jgi:hypothetical protein
VKRLTLLLLVLLAAGLFAATVFADNPPPMTTTTGTTAPPPTTTTAPAVGLIPDGVRLAGVAIGGLAPDAAAGAVTASFDRPVTLRFEGTTINVAPSLLGVSVPVESAIAKALTVPPGTSLALRASVNKLLVRAFILKIANRFDRKPVASRLLFRNSKPLVTTAVIGRTLNVARGALDLTNALVHGTRAPIVLRA